MNTHSLLKWAPRGLAVAFTIFISVFALDAFSGGAPLSEKLLGFAIHLIPTAVFALLTYVAWTRPLVGGVIFLILSLLTIFAFDTYEQWQSLLLITGLPFLTGLLFLADVRSGYVPNKA